MENNATVRLYSLGWREMRTYMFALLFIVGNIALPQLCHLFPQGGLILLPIYFFTLIAAYKFGFRVGLLTAILSPLINSALFGMPPAAALPIIMIKGVLLAGAAAWMANKSKGASLLALIGVVLGYQLVGDDWRNCQSTARLETGLARNAAASSGRMAGHQLPAAQVIRITQQVITDSSPIASGNS